MRNLLILIAASLLYTQAAVANAWKVRVVKDEFSGSVFTRIHTDYLSLNQPLGFPYQNLRAIAAVDCSSGGDKDVFNLLFSQDPNLTNFTLEKLFGNEIYKLVTVQVKLDGNDIKTFTAYNKIGSSWLTFGERTGSPAILASKNVMIKMDFYNGARHITIDMTKMQKCKDQLTKK